MVFLENYEANWKVTVNGNSVPESSHMTYDGFANKWAIDETGNLEIEVFYAPQSLFVWTTLLSVTLIAVAFFVLWVLNTGKKPAEALRIFFDLVAKIAHKIAGKFRKN